MNNRETFTQQYPCPPSRRISRCSFDVRMVQNRSTILRRRLRHQHQLAAAQDHRPSQVVRRLIRRAYAEMEQRDMLSAGQHVPNNVRG